MKSLLISIILNIKNNLALLYTLHKKLKVNFKIKL